MNRTASKAEAKAAREGVERYERFMSLNASAADIARRLNRLTAGIDWARCTKTLMAREYAYGRYIEDRHFNALHAAVGLKPERS